MAKSDTKLKSTKDVTAKKDVKKTGSKKDPTKINYYKPDYSQTLEEGARAFSLGIETYAGSKYDQSISSGLLSLDLISGNGGIIPGMHTNLGAEQSAKTTTAMTSLNEAVNAEVPVNMVWDFEKTFSDSYFKDFWNYHLETQFPFGLQDAQGKWIHVPKIRSYQEHTAEPFFNFMHKFLKATPRKIKFGDRWFLAYDNSKVNQKMLKGKWSKNLFSVTKRLCVEVENGLPQGFMLIDSYPAMLPESADDDEQGGRRAQQASMFSDQIKRVKGLVTSRGFIWQGINQLRKNPGAGQYEPQEYEPGGEALKLYSDSRMSHLAIACPKPFQNYGERAPKKHWVEPGIDKGTTDTYRYIRLETIKNKIGGSHQGTQIFARIWVADPQGVAHGLDPVFDVWQYAFMTGQLKGNLKTFKFKMKGDKGKDHPLNGKEMSLRDLKALMTGNSEQAQAVGKKLKLDKRPKIREYFLKQLRTGEAYALFADAA